MHPRAGAARACSTTWPRGSTSTPPASVEVVEEFAEARDERLAKGEALVCHVVGTGEAARVVAVERHLP